MKQKEYILKTILILFIVNVFFVFAIYTSFAQIKTPKLSDTLSTSTFSKNTKIKYIDSSAENKVKVCKDVTCANPGIIDFEISENSPLVIDNRNIIDGKWIYFNSPHGHVYIANPITGLLKGTAWSETSGTINFEVTGQKVIINPKTGEWNGWAWASGPYGGWIKFNCENASCVKTTWRGQNNINSKKNIPKNTPIPPKIKNNKKNKNSWISNIEKTYKEKSKIINNTFNIFISKSVNLFSKVEQITSNVYNKAEQTTSDVYNTIYFYSMNIRNSILDKGI